MYRDTLKIIVYPEMYRDEVFMVIVCPDMYHDTVSLVVSSRVPAFLFLRLHASLSVSPVSVGAPDSRVFPDV